MDNSLLNLEFIVRRFLSSHWMEGVRLNEDALEPIQSEVLFTIHYSLFTIHYSLLIIPNSPLPASAK